MLMTQRFAGLFLSVVLSAVVWGQHSDIEIRVEGASLVVEPEVVEGFFGEAPNPANVADEPGFEIEDGQFVANQLLAFHALPLEINGTHRNLWYWSGVGDVTLGSSPESLTIEHPVSAQSLFLDSTTGAMTKAGFVIGSADDEGGLHQDLEFVLGNPAPASGVYVFGLGLSSPGTDNSNPVYFVLGSGVDDDILDRAVGFVDRAFVVPEPSTGLLGSIGLLGLIRRKRQAKPV